MRLTLWYTATRLAGLALFVWPEAVLLREPMKWLVDLDRHGLARGLPEYPWPAALLTYLPLGLGVPTILHYFAAVVLFLLLLDALAVWLLWRAGGRGESRGLWLWLFLFPALGPLMVTRFDIVPAVICVMALLALAARRSTGAGALLALGAGLKLWPALGLPAMLLQVGRDERVRVGTGFVACGLALSVATVAFAGLGRLWSPLVLQAERGLQIEAFAALPFLWLRFLSGDPAWVVQPSELCNCHELVGPGVGPMLAVAGFGTFAAFGGVLTLHVRALASPPALRPAGLAAVLLALTLIAWLATARVFSPQYMIWLAAPLAVLGVLPGSLLSRGELSLFLAACLLTHLVFPLGYEVLVAPPHFLQGPVLAVATLRDAIVIVLGVRLAVRAWRTTGPIPALKASQSHPSRAPSS